MVERLGGLAHRMGMSTDIRFCVCVRMSLPAVVALPAAETPFHPRPVVAVFGELTPRDGKYVA